VNVLLNGPRRVGVPQGFGDVLGRRPRWLGGGWSGPADGRWAGFPRNDGRDLRRLLLRSEGADRNCRESEQEQDGPAHESSSLEIRRRWAIGRRAVGDRIRFGSTLGVNGRGWSSRPGRPLAYAPSARRWSPDPQPRCNPLPSAPA